MWKLYSITAEHIAAIEQITYTLQQGVTTLIFGRNLDNDSQGSNGSGKSALLESISLAITGDTLRHVKMDEIINDRHDTARVYAELINVDRHERLTIERTLSRKAPQSVTCQHYVYDEQVDCTQANVSDYNTFICQTIGISKEDLFNNFILSKHKYKSFLASSDKDKKEIINRISNAVLVDEAIAKLDEDIVPVLEDSKKAELKIASANAAINAMQEQIDKAKEDLESKHQDRTRRLQELRDKLAAKRKENRELQQQAQEISSSILELTDVASQIQGIEDNTKLSYFECYDKLSELLKEKQISGFSNWKEVFQTHDSIAEEIEEKINCLQQDHTNVQSDFDNYMASQEDISQYDTRIQEYDKRIADIDKDSVAIKQDIRDIEVKIDQVKASLEQAKESVAQLKNSIAGTIQCPKCKHQFVLGSDVDVAKVQKQIEQHQQKVDTIQSNLEQFRGEQDALNAEESKVREDKRSVSQMRDDCVTKQRQVQQQIQGYRDKLARIQQDIEDAQRKLSKKSKEMDDDCDDMFDEARSLAQTATISRKANVDQINISIESNHAIMETTENTIKELESAVDDNTFIQNLKDSLQANKEKLKQAMDEASRVNLELENLNMQKTRFVEFKTYLANTKIEALNQVTNDFLERIGSDIRIQFSGYTVLKSGKVRDKISISLVRNGVDGGSFDKFSEGEKARVNLANILAMNALANSNSEAGRGLDLLILDEILEATDEDGLANIFQAINNLGITALVVSHGNVAENYPYRLVVNKRNGVSFINE